MRYVGVDVGKGKCVAAFVDEDGVLVDESRLYGDKLKRLSRL